MRTSSTPRRSSPALAARRPARSFQSSFAKRCRPVRPLASATASRFFRGGQGPRHGRPCTCEQPARRRVNRRALLDINVLVALFDPDHVHHELAHDWFADHRGQGGRRARSPERARARALEPALRQPGIRLARGSRRGQAVAVEQGPRVLARRRLNRRTTGSSTCRHGRPPADHRRLSAGPGQKTRGPPGHARSLDSRARGRGRRCRLPHGQSRPAKSGWTYFSPFLSSASFRRYSG